VYNGWACAFIIKDEDRASVPVTSIIDKNNEIIIFFVDDTILLLFNIYICYT
jgi:hypothetical protein